MKILIETHEHSDVRSQLLEKDEVSEWYNSPTKVLVENVLRYSTLKSGGLLIWWTNDTSHEFPPKEDSSVQVMNPELEVISGWDPTLKEE